MRKDREFLNKQSGKMQEKNSATQGTAPNLQFPSDEEVMELTRRIIEEDQKLLIRLAE